MASALPKSVDGAPSTLDEGERVAILRALAILDTPAEIAFDELAQAAARICDTPIAAVSLVDANRQWFKAEVGLGVLETPRDQSFCAHAMWKDDLFVVPDASHDALFRENPLVTGAPNIRFYAGAAIRSPEGAPLGALCVISPAARPDGLSETQQVMLRVLANQVEAQLKLRHLVHAQANELVGSHGREDRLLKALASADVGWWDWDVVANRVVANAEMARIFGRSFDEVTKGVGIDCFFANVHPADRASLRDAVEFAVETGETFQEDYRVLGADGELTWVSARGRALIGANGKAQSFPGVAMDVTEQKRSEERLRDADMGRQLALEAARMGYWDHKPHLGERFYDARAIELLGVRPHEVEDLSQVMDHTHADDRERMAVAIKRAMDPRRSGPFHESFRHILPSGEERWIRALGRTQFADGVCTRFFGVLEDVTAPRRADAHRRLLVNELNHRVKNTLALMQSLVDSTLRNSTDTADARTKINARVQALGRAHDQLTASNWSAADVGQVVEALMGSLSLPRERLELVGQPARLGPQPSLQLSLALHELATNAMKYGALSNDTGRIRIEWSVDETTEGPSFALAWTERGGPTVSTPTRKGFGSQLIERATAAAFGGQVSLDYEPAGVRWRVVAPYAGLAESGRAPVSEG